MLPPPPHMRWGETPPPPPGGSYRSCRRRPTCPSSCHSSPSSPVHDVHRYLSIHDRQVHSDTTTGGRLRPNIARRAAQAPPKAVPRIDSPYFVSSSSAVSHCTPCGRWVILHVPLAQHILRDIVALASTRFCCCCCGCCCCCCCCCSASATAAAAAAAAAAAQRRRRTHTHTHTHAYTHTRTRRTHAHNTDTQTHKRQVINKR